MILRQIIWQNGIPSPASRRSPSEAHMDDCPSGIAELSSQLYYSLRTASDLLMMSIWFCVQYARDYVYSLLIFVLRLLTKKHFVSFYPSTCHQQDRLKAALSRAGLLPTLRLRLRFDAKEAKARPISWLEGSRQADWSCRLEMEMDFVASVQFLRCASSRNCSLIVFRFQALIEGILYGYKSKRISQCKGACA